MATTTNPSANNTAAASEAGATPPASLPFIITFGYNDFVQNATDRKAKCTLCNCCIKEKGSTTSNFVRHYREVHPERHDDYKKARRGPRRGIGRAQRQEGQQGSLDDYVTHQTVTLYSQGHPRQKIITESIIQDLVISCNLPLSLVDTPGFQTFMSKVDEKYNIVGRNTVTRRLGDLAANKATQIKSKLQKVDTVSVTVDIWSDRSMRGFLGVTAHFMEMEKGSTSKLQSVLLSCDRFKGSHTGARISDKFEEICDNFDIKEKLDYIITDNASNMKKAFTVCFPSTTRTAAAESESDDEGDDGLDNVDLWEDVTEDLQEDVNTIHRACRHQRLQCFAHSLQLVVRDGLKETKIINTAMAKVTKFCSLLHTTCGLKEAFEKAFGANRSIPAAVTTRWNSTLRLVKSVTDLDPQTLNTLLEEEGHKNLCLSGKELSQLKELVEILLPFLEATDLTQGEKVVTLSAALPSILSLNNHLNSMKKARQLGGLVKALQKSLLSRFQGMFVNVRMEESNKPAQVLPFGDVVYMMAALLDPSYCLFWLEHDVLVPEDIKSELEEVVMDYVLAATTPTQDTIRIRQEQHSSGEEEEDPKPSPTPAKVPRLFAGYRKKSKKKKSEDRASSVKAELKRYIERAQIGDDDEEEALPVDCMKFWNEHAQVFPRIYQVAMTVLSVPATSAPVERVFSHGGIIMRPHRARLSSTNLSSLIFLKCNTGVA